MKAVRKAVGNSTGSILDRSAKRSVNRSVDMSNIYSRGSRTSPSEISYDAGRFDE